MQMTWLGVELKMGHVTPPMRTEGAVVLLLR